MLHCEVRGTEEYDVECFLPPALLHAIVYTLCAGMKCLSGASSVDALLRANCHIVPALQSGGHWTKSTGQ